MILSELCLQVAALARTVGEFIAQKRQHIFPEHIIHKGVRDLVSLADIEAEQQLVAGLREILPAAGFLTEEGTAAEESNSLQWVIDPLDGTTNYVRGVPVYAVSVALLDGPHILVGVVYEVNRKECFYAWQKGGAWCNGQPIEVSRCSILPKALIATGFPYRTFGEEKVFFHALRYFFHNTQGVRRLGSAAVDLAYVACGRFDAFYEYQLNAWDVAAGALIVSEAGGIVSDFSGGTNYIWGRQILAATPAIHQEVLHIITQPPLAD